KDAIPRLSRPRCLHMDGCAIGRRANQWAAAVSGKNLTTNRTQSNNLPDYFSLQKGEAFLAAQVQVTQIVLIEAKLIKYGRVNVAEMTWLLDSSQPDVIGRTDDLPAFDPAAGHPHSEPEIVMIAALAALS